MKTYSPRASDVTHNWYVVDAAGKRLGRLATEIAKRLRGKHKPEYTPHMDMGDYIIVLNADKIEISGNKAADKKYYKHSGRPGSLKVTTFEKMRAEKPCRTIEIAIKGMLPKGPLGRDMYRKLKVYAGDKHDHEAQQPIELNLDEAK
jgi:large subunit ribosomal protein L13